MNKFERMTSSMLDGVEFGNFEYQGGSPNTPMKVTGCLWQPEEVAEILSFNERMKEEESSSFPKKEE